ncbi:MAG: hypothetical protein ACE5HL_10500 [Terriglobia bacterium]
MGFRPDRRTPLTDILVERIEREGRLTFAAFMEACLYDPEHGYYTQRLPATGTRDYFTSVDVGRSSGGCWRGSYGRCGSKWAGRRVSSWWSAGRGGGD